MEKLDKIVGPGTAGLAQRMPISRYQPEEENEGEELYVVRRNKVMPCGQNQY